MRLWVPVALAILVGCSAPAEVERHAEAPAYDKLGVSSRDGAALFMMEQGLLRAGG